MQNQTRTWKRGIKCLMELRKTPLQAQPGFFGRKCCFWKNIMVVQLSVCTLADCDWRAAAPGLPSACRAPQCKNPPMGIVNFGWRAAAPGLQTLAAAHPLGWSLVVSDSSNTATMACHRDKTDFCRCLEVVMNQVRGMKQRPSRPASLGPEMLQVCLVSKYTS